MNRAVVVKAVRRMDAEKAAGSGVGPSMTGKWGKNAQRAARLVPGGRDRDEPGRRPSRTVSSRRRCEKTDD